MSTKGNNPQRLWLTNLLNLPKNCYFVKTQTPDMSKAVYCPNCGFQAQADDMNMSALVARCRNCNNVYPLQPALEQNLPVSRPEVAMPAAIQAVHYPDALDIEVKWRSSASSFMLFFTIFWNIFVIPFGFFAVTSGEWSLMLGLSFHLITGIGLLYYMVASLMNVTYIYLDSSFLSIQHRPFAVPWYPDREIATADIRQLSVERYSPSKTNGKPDYFFAVYATLAGGKRLKILQGLKTADQGRYVEQEVERFLEIPDKG
jgi:hypothetical protein